MNRPTWTWPDDVEEVLRRRADRLRAPAVAHQRRAHPHLVVVAGGERCALPTDRLAGVIDPGVVTPIPRREAPWVGITIVRGGLHPVADLAALLTGVVSTPAGQPPIVLVQTVDRGPVGLRVDRALGTEELSVSVGDADRPQGLVHTTTADLVHVLDVDAVLSRLAGTSITSRGTYS